MAKESLYAQVRASHERRAREVHERLLAKALGGPAAASDFAVVAARPVERPPAPPVVEHPTPRPIVAQPTPPPVVAQPTPPPAAAQPTPPPIAAQPTPPPIVAQPTPPPIVAQPTPPTIVAQPTPPPLAAGPAPAPARPVTWTAPTPSGRPINPSIGQSPIMDPAWLAPTDRSKPADASSPATGPESKAEPKREPITTGWEVAPPRPAAASPTPSRPPTPGPHFRADWELAPEEQPAAHGREKRKEQGKAAPAPAKTETSKR